MLIKHYDAEKAPYVYKQYWSHGKLDEYDTITFNWKNWLYLHTPDIYVNIWMGYVDGSILDAAFVLID